MDLESIVNEAVAQFPAIKETIGTEKLLSIAKANQRSPIVYFLSRSMPDESKIRELVSVLEKDPKHVGALVVLDNILRPHYVLKHLNTCLSLIQGEQKLDSFLEHILDSNSFWQGYCEVEVASNLKNVFGRIELEPQLPNGKVVDIKFPLNSDDIYVEVTVPKKSYKFIKAMEESAEAHKVVELEAPVERASDKILAELQHFVDVLEHVQSVIVINLNESEIEDLDIEDSLMGVSRLVLLKNLSTGEVQSKIARGDWTAFSRDSKLAKIGAIICYKREFALNGDVIYSKKIFAVSFTQQKCERLLNLL